MKYKKKNKSQKSTKKDSNNSTELEHVTTTKVYSSIPKRIEYTTVSPEDTIDYIIRDSSSNMSEEVREDWIQRLTRLRQSHLLSSSLSSQSILLHIIESQLYVQVTYDIALCKYKAELKYYNTNSLGRVYARNILQIINVISGEVGTLSSSQRSIWRVLYADISGNLRTDRLSEPVLYVDSNKKIRLKYNSQRKDYWVIVEPIKEV